MKSQREGGVGGTGREMLSPAVTSFTSCVLWASLSYHPRCVSIHVCGCGGDELLQVCVVNTFTALLSPSVCLRVCVSESRGRAAERKKGLPGCLAYCSAGGFQAVHTTQGSPSVTDFQSSPSTRPPVSQLLSVPAHARRKTSTNPMQHSWTSRSALASYYNIDGA